MGSLSQTDVPRGLPRGRGSLPAAVVADAQRERLLRAAISTVAERGYANVRIADIVDRARVSRQSFYAHFADREECFLAAHADGIALIVARLGAWALDAAGLDARAQLRGGIATYLKLVEDEPEFAHCMLVELQAIGPDGLAARLEAHRQIAVLIAAWHAQARLTDSDWPAVPPSRYAAVVGAIHDLVFATVVGEAASSAGELIDDAFGAALALLGVPA